MVKDASESNYKYSNGLGRMIYLPLAYALCKYYNGLVIYSPEQAVVYVHSTGSIDTNR